MIVANVSYSLLILHRLSLFTQSVSVFDRVDIRPQMLTKSIFFLDANRGSVDGRDVIWAVVPWLAVWLLFVEPTIYFFVFPKWLKLLFISKRFCVFSRFLRHRCSYSMLANVLCTLASIVARSEYKN